MPRCMLKRTANGKFRFRSGKGAAAVMCSPSASARRAHAKKFGRSGGRAHKRHAKMMYENRARRMLAIRERRGMNRIM